jgi:WD40 repeat protein/DNA-binding winged helix-turn-helix (wHTH) protein
VTTEAEHHELPDSPFRIGDWLVEPRLNRLTCGEESTQIELKMMDVLVCLAQRAGELVTRREITDTVWATEYITEKTLTRAVAELRRTFGDDAKNPRYIETIHRKGYRLIPPVEPVERPPSTVTPFPVRSPDSVDDRNPYPGLAAFTEDDAEFFFGREAEVAQLWRRITTRRLLAVIGPSGVGKSSFLRAGLLPAKPDGWGTLICQPGDDPFAGLARALLPDFEGDREAVAGLVGVRDAGTAATLVARWRQRHGRALLIVDQFEELFTQNPPEAQADFAVLLRKLVDGGDIHILLAMRDDFLYRCHDHEALTPVFSEITPVKVPAEEDLRRALQEPAARFGYAFENDLLVDEMLETVEGERGALPMLAFAVARMWEERDHERKLLTREAYDDIGGVAGALAHHAEATLERIGRDRLGVVREIFRNLVTAEGTRAVRQWNELLSVFSDSRSESQPEEVLRHLVAARLLNSYEVAEGDEAPTRSVEIIHESLLGNWPRFVGWQTQDADSARMRDELRRAARTWEEHDRSPDYLWAGKAFREYSVWRENYPGGLTEIEEGFASAMVAHAKSRRRRRRAAVAAAFLALLVVLGLVGVSRQHALSESRRAEASNLVALGQLELERNPSAAVAYATASLEQADTQGARMLAQAALWRGPTAFVVDDLPASFRAPFSPDGSWLLHSSLFPGEGPLNVVSANGSREVPEGFPGNGFTRFFRHAGLFSVWERDRRRPVRRVVLGAVPDRSRVAEAVYDGSVWIFATGASPGRLLMLVVEGEIASLDALGADGTHERLGTPNLDAATRWYRRAAIDSASGRWLGVVAGDEVIVIDIGETALSEPRSLGRLDGTVAGVATDPAGRFLATAEGSGEIRLWDVSGNAPPTVLQGPPGIFGLDIAEDGSLLAANAKTPESPHVSERPETGLAHRERFELGGQYWVWALDAEQPRLLGRFRGRYRKLDPMGRYTAMDGRDQEVHLRSLAAPPVAETTVLRRGEVGNVYCVDFHPGGRWLASGDQTGVALWPLARPYPAVIRAHTDEVISLVFGPEGRWLASGSKDNTLKIWPLDSDSAVQTFGGSPGKVTTGPYRGIAWSPDRSRLLVVSEAKGVQLLPLDPSRNHDVVDLQAFDDNAHAAALSADGRLAAATTLGFLNLDDRVVRIWDVESMQEVTVLGQNQPNIGHDLEFTGDGGLLSGTEGGLCLWDLETGTSELLYEGKVHYFAASATSGRVLLIDTPADKDRADGGDAVLLDPTTGAVNRIDKHGSSVRAVAIDSTGELVVTGSLDGSIRVGKASGGEPHLLLGHDGSVRQLALDPAGRWIASGGTDGTVRLWPMPDLDATPFHTLPRDELIAKLETLTNLRAVRDEEAASGWKIDIGPFPGWETVPSW